MSTLFQTQSPLGFSGRLLDEGGAIARRGMAALAVIEHGEVFKHACSGGRQRLKVLPIDQFRGEGVEKLSATALSPPFPWRPIRGWQPGLAQDRPIAVGAIRTPPVRRHAHPRDGLPVTEKARFVSRTHSPSPGVDCRLLLKCMKAFSSLSLAAGPQEERVILTSCLPGNDG